MRRKTVLLYYPLLNRSRQERDYHWFPYSVLPLAQSLANHGYEPVVIDRRVRDVSLGELRVVLDRALFVGISAMSGYQISDALDVVTKVRGIAPNLPIVWGGWHATILPEETAEDPRVDVAVAGRGEDTILEIAATLEKGSSYDGIVGIAFKDAGRISFAGYKTPSPLRDDALMYDKYIGVESYINPATKALGYFSAHGCVFKCTFCSRHYMTNKYTPYSIEKVMEDLKYFVDKYSFRHIHFQDDCFFVDTKRALRLAESLVQSGLGLTWWANTRCNVLYKLSKEQMDLLVRSGLRSVFLGVESAAPELLDIMDKGITPDDIVKTCQFLRGYEVCPNLSYMFGVPGDDLKKLKTTIGQVKLLRQINPRVSVQTCFYQPYPGTRLYEDALRWGYPRLHGLDAWAETKSQSEVARIPWLSELEMAEYQREFNCFFQQEAC